MPINFKIEPNLDHLKFIFAIGIAVIIINEIAMAVKTETGKSFFVEWLTLNVPMVNNDLSILFNWVIFLAFRLLFIGLTLIFVFILIDYLIFKFNRSNTVKI